MTPRIEKAIDIFLDAINEGTLGAGICTACACGNLVAANLGIKINPKNLLLDDPIKLNTLWADILMLDTPSIAAVDQIELTGFTVNEFIKIENAFEKSTTIKFFEYSFYRKHEIRADQIRGLEAVVKVMLEFDNAKEDYKEVFTKRAELIPL